MATFTGSFVNNAWRRISVETITVTNPSDGTVAGTISNCGAAEATAALSAAKSAFPSWSALGIDGRAAHILAWKAALLANKAKIVSLLIAETGKVRGNAEYDFDMLINCLGYHIEEARRACGAVIPSPDGGALSYTTMAPVGVVVAVLTWNFPLLNLAYKIGPILASGCTCVIKQSEYTPLATSAAIELLAGLEPAFPAGVVNLVNGTGLSTIEHLCASKIPRLLTCIGSTVMGRRMIGYSATSIKRFSLELGGDAPVLVFADADLDAAVDDICGLKWANGGQICVSPNRVLVHESLYDAFLTKAVAKAKTYVFGSGDAAGDNVLQPIVSAESRDRLRGLIADAQAKGARVLVGDDDFTAPAAGFWLAPTVIADVTAEMEMGCCEIFGPILGVRSFTSDDEAFRVANESEYGLSGYVYTTSLKTATRAEKEIECGNICINGAHYSIELPHGGLKQSGMGKDISMYSMREYYDVKRVSIQR